MEKSGFRRTIKKVSDKNRLIQKVVSEKEFKRKLCEQVLNDEE
jgi:hypothetical protein